MPVETARRRAQAMPCAEIEPSGEELLTALRALAKGLAIGSEAMDPSIDHGVLVREGPDSGASGKRSATAIDQTVWRHIVKRGWTVPHEAKEGWRISNAGRIALKRMISRKGAPGENTNAPKSDPPAVPQFARASPPAPKRSSSAPKQNDNESPLGWLRQRRDKHGRHFISEAQFNAGERLRRDFTFGSMMPNVTSNWTPVISGPSNVAADRELELQDGQLRARERFRAAVSNLEPELSGVVVDVCCFLMGLEDVEKQNGWPQRTAKVVLGIGLCSLARHYGYEENPSRRDERRHCG